MKLGELNVPSMEQFFWIAFIATLVAFAVIWAVNNNDTLGKVSGQWG